MPASAWPSPVPAGRDGAGRVALPALGARRCPRGGTRRYAAGVMPGSDGRFIATHGRVGEPLPELVLPRLDGETLDLRELRGRRVALFFWGSW